MRIGFVGLGVMGSAMAGHLARGGHTLALHDIAPAAARKVARRHNGARAARSPREVAQASEVVFTMLPDGPAVRECVSRRGRPGRGLRAGRHAGRHLLGRAVDHARDRRAPRRAGRGHGRCAGLRCQGRRGERHARLHVRRRGGGARAGAPAAGADGPARVPPGPGRQRARHEDGEQPGHRAHHARHHRGDADRQGLRPRSRRPCSTCSTCRRAAAS